MSKQEQRATRCPDNVSAKTLLYLLKEDTDEDTVVAVMEELKAILGVAEPRKLDHYQLLLLFLGCLAEWQQMHDYHMPFSVLAF